MTKRRVAEALWFVAVAITLILWVQTQNDYYRWLCNFGSVVCMLSIFASYAFCKNKKLDENPRAISLKVKTLWPYAFNQVLPYRASSCLYAIIIVQSFFSEMILVSTAHLVMAYFEGKLHEMALQFINVEEIKRQVWAKIQLMAKQHQQIQDTHSIKLNDIVVGEVDVKEIQKRR